MCNLFKWGLVFIISTDSQDEGELGNAINSQFIAAPNITVARYMSNVPKNPSVNYIENTVYAKVKEEARSKMEVLELLLST